MLGNLGVHVIKNPVGTYSFVGTLPAVLGELTPATTADVMGGRAHTAPDGTIVTLRFPVFGTWEAAVVYAADRGVAVNASTC